MSVRSGVIPGKSVMGLEIANEKRELSPWARSCAPRPTTMWLALALALGKDIAGQAMVADWPRCRIC